MLREYVKWDYELRTPVQLESVVDRRARGDARRAARARVPHAAARGPRASRPRQSHDDVTVPASGARRAHARPRPDRGGGAHPGTAPSRPSSSCPQPAWIRAPWPRSSSWRRPAASASSRRIPIYLNFPPRSPAAPRLQPVRDERTPRSRTPTRMLVVEADVPWYPALSKPAAGAPIIHLGIDPFFSRYPMRSYPCDVPIAADPGTRRCRSSRRRSGATPTAAAVARAPARIAAEHRRAPRDLGRPGTEQSTQVDHRASRGRRDASTTLSTRTPSW